MPSNSRIVGPAQLVGHAMGSGEAWGNLTVTPSRIISVPVGQAVERDQALPVAPRIERARELTAEEQGLRAVVVAGAMQIAVTDWGWSGTDAALFALMVWFAVGWLLRQR